MQSSSLCWEQNLISRRSRLNHASCLTISLLNPERRIDDHFMTPNTECVCGRVGVNLVFRACTMPVQSDRAESVIAESGDSTKDTVSAQLHRYAGAQNTHSHACTYRNTHTHARVQRSGEAIQLEFHLEVCVCERVSVCVEVFRSLYYSGNIRGVSV